MKFKMDTDCITAAMAALSWELDTSMPDKGEYKFYKDRPVNEIQDQDTETEDSLPMAADPCHLETDTEVPEESDDDIETVAEPGYNFIQIEAV